MKNWLFFGGGVIVGVVLTVVLSVMIAKSSSLNGVTWFDNPGEVIDRTSFEVFQVIDKNAALVYDVSIFGTIYCLTNDEGKYYYDDEKIDVPQDKVVRQVGIYKYKTRNETEKTVPIIKIMNK